MKFPESEERKSEKKLVVLTFQWFPHISRGDTDDMDTEQGEQ